MLKEKKGIRIAMVLACSVALTACAGKGEKPVNFEKEHARIETSVAPSAEKEKEGARILVTNSASMTMATTEDGLYRIAYEEISDGIWANKIYYVDYASAKEIVLCSDASCRHDSEECTGVLMDEECMSMEVFTYKDKVYIYSTQDMSGMVETVVDTSGLYKEVTYPAKLYEMNMDGTGRRLVKEFSTEYTMGETVLAWNGELIFTQKKLEQKKDKDGKIHHDSVDSKLVSLNPSNGNRKELMDISDEYTLNGTYQNYLIFQKTNYADGYTQKDADKMEFEEWRELMERSTSQFIMLDLESGKEIPFYEVSNLDLSGCIVLGDKMYLNNDTEKVLCIDLKTKDSTTIKMKDKYVMVQSVGDRIYCWRKGCENQMYFWDPVSNEIQRADMKIKGTNLSAEIIAYTDNDIITICAGDYQASPDEPGSYEVKSTIFGINKKKDLYKGITDYVPVEMCSKGVAR